MARSRAAYADAQPLSTAAVGTDVSQPEAGFNGVLPDTVIPGEEWRAISWTPTHAVSSLGRVMRLEGGHGRKPGHIHTQKPNSNGYPRVCVMVGGKYRYALVHILVCEAFHDPRPSPLHEAAHGDGDHTNCAKGNLRWATRSENENDKLRHGTAPRGSKNGRSKFSDEVVRAIRAAGGMQRDIARQYGMSEANVSMIRSGKLWSHI